MCEESTGIIFCALPKPLHTEVSPCYIVAKLIPSNLFQCISISILRHMLAPNDENFFLSATAVSKQYFHLQKVIEND